MQCENTDLDHPGYQGRSDGVLVGAQGKMKILFVNVTFSAF
jgi:hypothetical protein